MRRRLVIALLMLGCGGPPTFTRVQTEVFSASCTFSSCHIGTGAEGLNLEKPAYAHIVNVKAQGPDAGTVYLVVPGKPDESYLYEKLSKDMPRTGVRMPNTGEPLEPGRLQLVRDWIANGAQND